MTDAEIRGRLLTHFYRLRHSHGGWVPVEDIILAGAEPVPSGAIEGVCRHLSQLGLIEWQGYIGQGPRIGAARITANGSSRVLKNSFPPQFDSVPDSVGFRCVHGLEPT
jgi:hypothetical protein